ncbi:MAG: hypothetical protein EBS51_10775 [Planctomycetia bacterium]|jgi:hypothetical protein|nr:hypothetical protein [Planctomycetia bacterium]
MQEPARNRLHPYEAGWLTLLLAMRVAGEGELRAAQARVAQAALDRMNSHARRRARRKRRRDDA